MIKPPKLNKGDIIATISPSWGCAGDEDVRWKYELGVKRLEELGLHVVAAPNSLKGADFLEKHPEKRAEDVSGYRAKAWYEGGSLADTEG